MSARSSRAAPPQIGVGVDVDTGILGDVAPGELVLVHAGTALARAAGAGA